MLIWVLTIDKMIITQTFTTAWWQIVVKIRCQRQQIDFTPVLRRARAASSLGTSELHHHDNSKQSNERLPYQSFSSLDDYNDYTARSLDTKLTSQLSACGLAAVHTFKTGAVQHTSPYLAIQYQHTQRVEGELTSPFDLRVPDWEALLVWKL